VELQNLLNQKTLYHFNNESKDNFYVVGSRNSIEHLLRRTLLLSVPFSALMVRYKIIVFTLHGLSR
jgi:hypothetical protein